MWARIVEVMLACWLALSPFIFRHAPENTGLWVNDLGCAVAVMLLALVSFRRPLRHAHLLIAIVGLWLVVFAFMAGYPAPPSAQNHVFLGLLLLMFSIIPNEANLPPPEWRRSQARDHS